MKKDRVKIDTRVDPNDRMRLEELSTCLGCALSELVRAGIKILLEYAYNDEGYIRDEVRQAISERRGK